MHNCAWFSFLAQYNNRIWHGHTLLLLLHPALFSKTGTLHNTLCQANDGVLVFLFGSASHRGGDGDLAANLLKDGVTLVIAHLRPNTML
jgi:hypothetical protein